MRVENEPFDHQLRRITLTILIGIARPPGQHSDQTRRSGVTERAQDLRGMPRQNARTDLRAGSGAAQPQAIEDLVNTSPADLGGGDVEIQSGQ